MTSDCHQNIYRVLKQFYPFKCFNIIVSDFTMVFYGIFIGLNMYDKSTQQCYSCDIMDGCFKASQSRSPSLINLFLQYFYIHNLNMKINNQSIIRKYISQPFFIKVCVANYIKKFQSITLQEIILVEALKLDDVKPGVYNLHCLPLRLLGAEGSPIRCILVKQASTIACHL